MLQPKNQKFLEKHGGTVISVAFHLAFFMLLQNYSLPLTRVDAKPEPEPIRIELRPPAEPVQPAPADPEPPVEMPPIPELEENVATVADPNAGEDSGNEAAGEEGEAGESEAAEREVAAARSLPAARPAEGLIFEPGPAEIAPLEEEAESEPEPVLPEDSTAPPPPEDESAEPIELDARIQTYLKERESALNEYNDAVGQRGSDSVAQKLRLARAELEGKRWLESTEGAQEGAIRSFAVASVDRRISEEVFARYGIESYSQYVDEKTGGDFGYLNSAKLGGTQYIRRSGQGMFMVLSIPESALARLAQLERDALLERGLNPASTRVIEVEFGIASVGKTFDLVVTNLKVAPIQFQP